MPRARTHRSRPEPEDIIHATGPDVVVASPPSKASRRGLSSGWPQASNPSGSAAQRPAMAPPAQVAVQA
eukprot:11757911-Heterocapsa_arctica.AAC.1